MQVSNCFQPEQHFNPTYNFDNFVVGKNNQKAFSFILCAIENPGTRFNPLYIYGGTGVGKTHILHAIGLKVVEATSIRKISACYMSAEQWVRELCEAISAEAMSDFQNKWSRVDLLLIDDVDFLAGKEATQEMFLQMIGALYERGKQVVLNSSSRPEKEIYHLEMEMRNRFPRFHKVVIQPPDYDTRKAILKNKCRLLKINLSEELIEHIAHSEEKDIRLLEGSLHIVQHYSELY